MLLLYRIISCRLPACTMHDHFLLSCNKNSNKKRVYLSPIYSSSIHDDSYLSLHLLKFVCYSLLLYMPAYLSVYLPIPRCLVYLFTALFKCLFRMPLFSNSSYWIVPASVENRSLLEPHFYSTVFASLVALFNSPCFTGLLGTIGSS
jgi:hypothetical protein